MLGTHVGGRAKRRTILCQNNCTGEFRNTEIQDFNFSARIDHDVFGLDVAVHDAGLMSPFKALSDLECVVGSCFWLHGIFCKDLSQASTVDILHDEKEAFVRFADVIEGTDVGVRQRRRGTGFLQKPVAESAIPNEPVSEKFQCDISIKSSIPGAIHHAHAATAEFFKDFVVRNRLANHCNHLILE